MKFVPDAIGRKIGDSNLLASEHAPKVLFVGGVVGMVSSTVLACRATLKLSDVLDRIEHEKLARENAKRSVEDPTKDTGDATYPEKEFRRDIALIGIKGVGDITKLYAPAVIVGGVSVLALTKSHNMLQDRNLALTAAYAAVDTAYKNYRTRVIDRFGEEVDEELRYEIEELDIVDEETGEVQSKLVATDAPGSPYKRFYDQQSSVNWSPDPDVNMIWLKNVQHWANEKLRMRGHLFLNEVYKELGLSHTRAGAVVGWQYNKDTGDDYVDFGIWNSNESAKEFFNGREGAILLDFNVDGVIADKIEEDWTPGAYR